MSMSELRNKSVSELESELIGLFKEHVSLRIQKAMGQLKTVHVFKNLRKKIAQIKTVLGEKSK